jgi:hypothetical protein
MNYRVECWFSYISLQSAPPQVSSTPTQSPLYPSLKDMAPTTPTSPSNTYSQTQTTAQTPQKTSTPTPQKTATPIPQKTATPTPQKTATPTPQKTPQAKSPAPQTPKTPQNFFQRTPQHTPQPGSQTTPQQPTQSTFLDKLQASTPNTSQSPATVQPGIHMEGETSLKIPSADLYVYDTAAGGFTLKQANVEVLLNDTSDEEVYACIFSNFFFLYLDRSSLLAFTQTRD